MSSSRPASSLHRSSQTRLENASLRPAGPSTLSRGHFAGGRNMGAAKRHLCQSGRPGSTATWEGGTNPTVVLPRMRELTNAFPEGLRDRGQRGASHRQNRLPVPQARLHRTSVPNNPATNDGPRADEASRRREPGPRPRRPPGCAAYLKPNTNHWSRSVLCTTWCWPCQSGAFRLRSCAISGCARLLRIQSRKRWPESDDQAQPEIAAGASLKSSRLTWPATQVVQSTPSRPVIGICFR